MNINILHISDLHYNKTDYDSNIVIKSFFEDIDNILKTYNEIDIVIFSGDLVKFGSDKLSFNEAYNNFILPLLERLKLSNSDFIITPGNHDIDITKVIDTYEPNINASIDTREKINSLIDDFENSNYNINFNRLSNYNDFITSQFSESLNTNRLFSTYKIVKKGISFGIINANTVLFATGKKDDYDYGKLIVGERQLDLAYNDIVDCNIKLLNMHHPCDYLKYFDRNDINFFINNKIDLLCTGHTHLSDFNNTYNNGNSFAWSKAGCLYQHRKFYNGYTLLQYESTNNQLTANYRSYFDSRRSFDVGLNVSADGKTSFNLNNNLSPIISSPLLKKISESYNELSKLNLISFYNDISAPKEFEEIFVIPKLSLKSDKEIKASKSEDNGETLNIDEMINNNENYFILGKPESGKTTLLHYIARQCANSLCYSKIKIPIYIDYNNIIKGPNPYEKSILNFFFEMDYNITKDETINLLEKGNFIVLIDNFNSKKGKNFERLNKFCKNFSNNKIILASNETLFTEMDLNKNSSKNKLSIDFTKVHLHTFSRNRTRELINNWFINKDIDDDIILNSILHSIDKMNVPRTPHMISILLWIYEKQNNFIPVNKASLMEKFFDILLEKIDSSNSRHIKFDFEDKLHYLSYIAYFMVDSGKYNLSRIELEEETINYFKIKRALTCQSPSQFINYFIQKCIFIETSNSITFKYKSYCEFFIAKRMIVDNDFMEY
ncbi:MAG: metallophosphoesterase, partial [Candidatus Cloacimonetes bacterium]|nr:metallophosphoesterase [Candidatus Cloacimonadota bacterium]